MNLPFFRIHHSCVQRLTGWLLALLLVWPSLVLGQSRGEIRGEVLRQGLGGMYRQGTWIPLMVRLENRSPSRFSGRLLAVAEDLDGDPLACRGEAVVLEPSEAAAPAGRDFWIYAWASPGEESKLQVVLEDLEGQQVLKLPLPRQPLRRLAPLQTDRTEFGLTDRPVRWVVQLGQASVGLEHFNQTFGGNAANALAAVERLSDLPDRALGLEGVDLLVWPQAGTISGEAEARSFQAILGWVRGGGHLVVSLASGYQSVAGSPLDAVLPMAMRGGEARENGAFLENYLQPRFVGLAQRPGPIWQRLGTLQPEARTLGATPGYPPVAATRNLGAGQITLVSVDLVDPKLHELLGPLWTHFWSATAAWPGEVYTESRWRKAGAESGTQTRVGAILLDEHLVDSLAFSRQTTGRLVLVLLFLFAYWLVAGPLGTWWLYRRVQMSLNWWLFGLVVLGASVLAVVLAGSWRLESYELRHQSFWLGSNSQKQASVLGFYGLLVPEEKTQTVSLPPGSGYLVPFSDALGSTSAFADPQPYDFDCQHPGQLAIPFRSTVKWLQGRWSGPTDARIEGRLEGSFANEELPPALRGVLTNRLGVGLQQVFLVYPGSGSDVGNAWVYRLGDWPAGGVVEFPQAGGEALDFKKARDTRGAKMLPRGPWKLKVVLEQARWLMLHGGELDEQLAEPQNWLRAFGEVLAPSEQGERREWVAHLTRGIDRTRALRSGGAMILGESQGAAPAPLQVGARAMPGRGTTQVFWQLEN